MLVSAVITDARDFQIEAIAKIAAPARETRSVMAAVPADTDALPLFPCGNVRTQFIDDARDFVSRDAGILNSGPKAFFREHIAVADATGLHFDAHLSRHRRGNLALDDLEIGTGLGNLRCLHWCDCEFCSCHCASFEFSVMLLGVYLPVCLSIRT